MFATVASSESPFIACSQINIAFTLCFYKFCAIQFHQINAPRAYMNVFHFHHVVAAQQGGGKLNVGEQTVKNTSSNEIDEPRACMNVFHDDECKEP
jgi:hypothetical protein